MTDRPYLASIKVIDKPGFVWVKDESRVLESGQQHLLGL